MDIKDINEENRKSITEEVKKDAGNYIVFGDSDPLFLLGAIEEPFDFYYVVLNNKFALEFYSCAGPYKKIKKPQTKEGEYPPKAFMDEIEQEDLKKLYKKVEKEIREELGDSEKSGILYLKLS